MSDLEAYRAKAAAWCESVAPTFGKAARKGLSVEEDLALGRRLRQPVQAEPEPRRDRERLR